MKNVFLTLAQGQNLHRKNVEAINGIVMTCTGGPICRFRHMLSDSGVTHYLLHVFHQFGIDLFFRRTPT